MTNKTVATGLSIGFHDAFQPAPRQPRDPLGVRRVVVPEDDHRGTPWENPEGYETHNPINFVKNWKTPMLVIHGGNDFRIPYTQGIGTFTALQRRGIPSKFLYFPDENHWVLKPHNSILWHETVIGWLDQWLK